MYMVVRSYSGASALFDQMEQKHDDVREVISGTPGFISYSAIRDGDGVVTATICEDKDGVEESTRRAAEWIKENVSEPIDPPEITEGETFIHF